MQKKNIRNDVILIGIIFIVALVSLLIFKFSQKNGNFVVVNIGGETAFEYSLSKNSEQQIFEAHDNNYENLLVIKDGEAYISSANCPDKICKEHRPISKVGESIVCLPHKLVISIEER